MMPTFWLKAAPWIIAGVMALAAALAGKMYLSERDEFAAFRAEVKTLGEIAEREKQAIESERDANLEKVKEYERNLHDVVSNAVAAYRLRDPNASCSSMPGSSTSVKMDDGAIQKSMDVEFIKACADDAAKLETWLEWARLNKIPIE